MGGHRYSSLLVCLLPEAVPRPAGIVVCWSVCLFVCHRYILSVCGEYIYSPGCHSAVFAA